MKPQYKIIPDRELSGLYLGFEWQVSGTDLSQVHFISLGILFKQRAYAAAFVDCHWLESQGCQVHLMDRSKANVGRINLAIYPEHETRLTNIAYFRVKLAKQLQTFRKRDSKIWIAEPRLCKNDGQIERLLQAKQELNRHLLTEEIGLK
jgi:hypothetical protein